MVSQTDRNSLPPGKIAQAAKDRLRTTPYPTIQKLSCECDDSGVLFLRGRLPTFYQKQLAQEAVARLPGVNQVVNQTEVASSSA
jgi:osmotically-inducible protein OsmY